MRHHRDLMQEDAENYSAWCNDWQHAIPTNGEGFQAFSQRVERFIARLSEYQHYQNILVVSHQGVLESVNCSFNWHACRVYVAFPR